jgi:DNA uptake protein ComE-like DNA-binding protein
MRKLWIILFTTALAAKAKSATSAAEKLDINTATKDQLQWLPESGTLTPKRLWITGLASPSAT